MNLYDKLFPGLQLAVVPNLNRLLTFKVLSEDLIATDRELTCIDARENKFKLSVKRKVKSAMATTSLQPRGNVKMIN